MLSALKVISFASGMEKRNVCLRILSLKMVCCLTKTKVQLSRLETKTLHHMSFLIMLPALGEMHFPVANL